MDEPDRRKHNVPKERTARARAVAADKLIRRHHDEYLELLADEMTEPSPMAGVPAPRL